MRDIFPILLYATDYASRGRISDYSDSNDSTLELVFMAVGALILLVFGTFWLYFFLKKNKEIILDAISKIFFFSLIIGVVFLVAKCGENVKKSSSLKTSQPTIEQSNQNNTSSNHVESEESVCNPWAGFPPAISASDGERMKENDFLIAIINNPSFSIYDLLVVLGLNTDNTQFLSLERYSRSNYIRERYDPVSFKDVYNRCQRAWSIFCRMQNVDLDNPEISKYMMEYSPFDVSAPRINQASNPKLIQDLKIRPLHN